MKLLAQFAAYFFKIIGPDLVKWIGNWFKNKWVSYKKKKEDKQKTEDNVEDIQDAQKSNDRKNALKRIIDITKRRK